MMAFAIDFYSQTPPISTYTQENLDYSKLGGDNGRGASTFFYKLGPGCSPDNRSEFNTLAAEEDAEIRFLL